jgi:mannose-1-phosphate guanylyltransferase
MINVVLCGGSGTRLWPVSRTLLPKQFVKIFDKRSLFQKTVERNREFCSKEIVVSNVEHYFLALDQLEDSSIEDSSFILEPVGRNTAPAIALACFGLDYDEVVFVTPSDHLINSIDSYKSSIEKAKELALKNNLVTFGIKPTSAHIGFGYIEADELDVKKFHEKPELSLAKEYLKIGNYYWNSGMFCFKAGVYLEELQKYSPNIYEQSLKAFNNSKNSNTILRVDLEDMNSIDDDSIDYAVLEKSKKVKVVPSSFDWSDLGSFDSLYEELPKDENQNTVDEKSMSINSHNNLIMSHDRFIATIDVDDMIIVDTHDALLVTHKGSSQKVKEVVKELKNRNSNLTKVHNTAYRPWGSYTVLLESEFYKIKRIVVKPSQRLSLQKHYHRNEHWVVVSGTAVVTIDDTQKIVRANESTYIPMGSVHRLENPGKIDLVLIEAQVGEYTGEDDIVRLEDDYNRS